MSELIVVIMHLPHLTGLTSKWLQPQPLIPLAFTGTVVNTPSDSNKHLFRIH